MSPQLDATTLARAARNQSMPNVFGEFSAVAFGNECRFGFMVHCYAATDRLAIRLVKHDAEFNDWIPFMDLTSNVVGFRFLTPADVLVKTTGENEIMRDAVLATGFFEDCGRRIPSGYSYLEVWSITRAFMDASSKQGGFPIGDPKLKATT